MSPKHINYIFILFSFTSSIATSLQTLTPTTLITANSTLLSPNRTFQLGFFTVNSGSSWYLGIWYALIPIPTYVWVANRNSPVHLTPPSAQLTPNGSITLTDSSRSIIWQSDNPTPASQAKLLDNGNLVLLSPTGHVIWQSFDSPTDTWLPEMTVSTVKPFVSWRSPVDPSPGLYSLRLMPPEYGEFELVFNNSVKYWSTGNWTGTRFSNVPEMTIPYIYSFKFDNPFTPEAEFVYSETALGEFSLSPVLSRFVVDSSGEVRQYTWSMQAATWNMFWSRPEGGCRVYARCGRLGRCLDGLRPCDCVGGLRPVNAAAWSSGDYSDGCGNDGGSEFEDVGGVEFDEVVTLSIPGVSREGCEDSCIRNSSCFGIKYDGVCTNLYGNAYNLRNSTGGASSLYLRIAANSFSAKKSKKKWRMTVMISSICGLLTVLGMIGIMLIILRRRNCGVKEEQEEESINYPVTNLKVYTYKELSAATNSFSEKVGHGGFGAVFRGELSDSTPVAVKRLERPNGGDREFRAEVRTIGNIQHVNLVRLYGFCSEDAHRLLVYDYMPNGSLSSHLGRERQPLNWESRFRIAIGTARGIAYLHEECRDCIIHCDIKPENILLDGDYTPKVSDFGLAKLMGRDFSRVLATMRGTWGYVAPEWISGVAITAKADVYSYGMTLLEIIGGRRNVEAPQPAAAKAVEDGWYFPPWAARRIVDGDIAGIIDPGLDNYDVSEAQRAAMVAVWCIQDEEEARPTMGTVVKMLEGTIEVTTPPLPKLLQALVSGDSFSRTGIVSGDSGGMNESGSCKSES